MADAISPIGMKIVADMSDFGPKLKAGADQVNDFAAKTKASADSMSSGVQAASAKLTGFLSAFKSDGLSGVFSSATSGLEGFTSKLMNAGGVWGAFGAAGIAAMTGIAAAASRTASQIADINRLSRVLGTSNQDTQTLVQVFRNAGLDEDSARSSVLRFSGHLGEAAVDSTSSRAKAFQGIGLDPESLASRGSANAMEQTVEALRRLPSDAARNAASMEIFGKQFIDMADIVNRGSEAFRMARDTVRVGGFTDSAANNVNDVRRIDRLTEAANNARGGTVSQQAGQRFGDFASNFSLARSLFGLVVANQAPFIADKVGAGFLYHNDAGSGVTDRGGSNGRPPVSLDTYVAPPAGPSKAQLAAEDLSSKWTNTAMYFGMTARYAEILKAQADGVTHATVMQLVAQDEILTRLERRQAVEEKIAATVTQTQTLGEKYAETMREIASTRADVGMLPWYERRGANRALDRSGAHAFLQLERSLGNGPSSYAVAGIDPRSNEGAKYLADLKVRGEVQGASPEDRVRLVLEAIREIDGNQLRELQTITWAIRDLNGRADNGQQFAQEPPPAPNF